MVIRRYDVLLAPARRRNSPHLMVVLSSPHLMEIEVMIVAPLFSPQILQPDGKLNLAVQHDGDSSTVSVPVLKGVAANRPWRVVGSLRAYADEIDRATDRLFTGF